MTVQTTDNTCGPATFELVCCTQTILEEIRDGATQKSVATTYALAMRSAARGMDNPDWPAINKAILDRWGMAGLQRVKQMAWRLARN